MTTTKAQADPPLTQPCFVAHTLMHNSLISQLYRRPGRNVLHRPPACACMSNENDCGQLARGALSDTLRTLSVGGGQCERCVRCPGRSTTWAQRNSGEPVILYLRTEGDRLNAGNNTHKHSNKEDQMERSMHRSGNSVHLSRGPWLYGCNVI